MEKILDILKEARPDIDFEQQDKLIDHGILDSFDLVCIISDLNDEFGIEIKVTDLKPENFNSIHDIVRLVHEKQG